MTWGRILGWFGDLPADPGQQNAEFQRMQASATFGEGRKIWGQLPEYPSPMVSLAPLNPSLGGVFMQSLMVPPEATEGGEDDEGEQEGESASQEDLAGQVHSRLHALGYNNEEGQNLLANKEGIGQKGKAETEVAEILR